MASSEVVVFTGTLTTQTRKEATTRAQAAGYTVGASVTAATTILVYGDKAGKKLEDAKKKGITTFSEAEWAVKMSESGEAMEEEQDEAKPSKTKATRGSKRKAQAETSVEEKGDQVVVFTGTLISRSRKEATADAEARGYRVDARITKATTILVCGERSGQKRAEAEKMGIQILTEDEWEAKMDAEGSASSAPTKKAKGSPVKAASEDEPMEDAEPSYDEETAAINGVQPKTLIPDGTFMDVKSSSSNSTYVAKRIGSVYSCNCPAWRNQRQAATARTCKHLKEILGEAYEAVRVKGSASSSSGGSGASGAKKSTSKSKATAPDVLLAKKWEREKHDPVKWWISEKLDGVRAFWSAEKQAFLSRLGNVYPAPAWFIKDFPTDMDLDGELFGGRGRFQFTVGIAKTENSKHWEQLVYKVFDVPSLKQQPFEGRMQHAQSLIDGMGSKYVEWVEHTQCKSLKHLDEVFDEIEKLGGEGLMIREPGSRYMGGRSSSLLKIKSFHDGEAEVIAYEDGKGKYKGMCGALRCKMASGKMFKVASGLSDEQRENPPPIGCIIVYKCQELTDDKIPRFPVFVGVAADKDCPSDPVIANAAGKE
ncbi:hypothetical protein Poli38472_011514 [Pythium oligandrum]|uniref:DNA ligase n=1 Tax=Pythium oligandrum TaxID=41045 RepID=A0A8K1FKW9_PYTOL|nr:hypothetical protein Poli38472_011514 [Pythium oligandrum]|eukprot:TMW64634.1 hypothetical protein Poli38472_011514 [Pythium oligandrum]